MGNASRRLLEVTKSLFLSSFSCCSLAGWLLPRYEHSVVEGRDFFSISISSERRHSGGWEKKTTTKRNPPDMMKCAHIAAMCAAELGDEFIHLEIIFMFLCVINDGR
jgi:hypothetical protein